MEYRPRGRNEPNTTEQLSLSLFQKQEAPQMERVSLWMERHLCEVDRWRCEQSMNCWINLKMGLRTEAFSLFPLSLSISNSH